MKKKKVKFQLILLLFGTMLSIQSFGQTDSDSCFNSKQIDFFIEQCFSAKEYQKSLAISDTTIGQLLSVISAQNNTIDEKDNEKALLQQKYTNESNDCASDKKKLKDQVDALTKKTKWQKIGLWITSPVAILGSSFAGVSYLLKK